MVLSSLNSGDEKRPSNTTHDFDFASSLSDGCSSSTPGLSRQERCARYGSRQSQGVSARAPGLPSARRRQRTPDRGMVPLPTRPEEGKKWTEFILRTQSFQESRRE